MFRKNLLRTFTVAAILFTSVSSYAFRASPTDEWRFDPDDTRVSSFFVGFQGGYITSNWSDVSEAFVGMGFFAKLKEPGYAGRLSAGYYFSEYFGFEMGFLHVSGAGYQFKKFEINEFYDPNAPEPDPNDPPDPQNPTQRILTPFDLENTITANLFDLTLNVHVPLSSNTKCFAKFGLAYGAYKDAYSFKPKSVTISGSDQGNTAITFGAGLDYSWSRHVSFGVAWQYYQGNDDVKSFIADTNFFSMSIAYTTS